MPVSLTTITGPIYLPNGATPVGGRVSFELSSWDQEEGAALLVTGPVYSTIDENGQFSVQLYTSSAGINSVHYRMFVIWENSELSKNYVNNIHIGTPTPHYTKKFIGSFALSGPGPFQVSDLTIISEVNNSSFDAYLEMKAFADRIDLGVLDAAVASTSADVVLTHADAALTHADAIQTALDAASTAADRITASAAGTAAVAARDTTTLIAATKGAYRDTTINAAIAQGVAALTVGVTFTAAADDVDYIGLYKINAGPVAVEIARYATVDLVAPLLSTAPTGYAFSVVDGSGLAAFAIENSGRTVAESLFATEISGKTVGVDAGALFDGSPLGYAWAVMDADGHAAGGVKDSGTIAFQNAEFGRINGVLVSSIIEGGGGAAAVKSARHWSAEINMVVSYGQSLANGTDATPPISVVQPYDNIRFSGGVRTQDSVTPYTSFVPLVETQNSTFGETPVAGMTEMIKELILAEELLAYTDHSYQLLGTAPGVPAQKISSLVKGSGAYSRIISEATNGLALSQAAGKSFSLGAVTWTQGESDYQDNTDPAVYATALKNLRDDLDADIKAITGQDEPVVMISYQTAAHGSYGHTNNADIAVAQLKVANDNQHHYVACPLYWSPQVIHQSPVNSKILGAYYGLCYKRVVIDGDNWKPLQPISVKVQGAIVLVEFHVPVGNLVLDNSTIAGRTNAGFQLYNGATALSISSVGIVGPNTVKIVAASSIPPGAKLKYGQGGFGGGGNIRDQQGDAIVFDGGGINYPMHNWCAVFEETL